jgi:uncharacterized protein YjbI with pentapeptide repeats
MVKNLKETKFWKSLKFWSIVGAGAISLVLVGILTQQFTFKTGLFEWVKFERLKDFKEVVIPIVTAPVLLVVWWFRVSHHEETLAAQQKTNEIANTTAKTAQSVAKTEENFKEYDRRYTELNDIKNSLVALKPLIFNKKTFQLENPNDHITQNAAILALAQLTDFLQEDKPHLQSTRRAAFILLKQTWASYVRESYEQVQNFLKDFGHYCNLYNELSGHKILPHETEDEYQDILDHLNRQIENHKYHEIYTKFSNFSRRDISKPISLHDKERFFSSETEIAYSSDSIIQQLTKALLRGLKSKDKEGDFIRTEDDRYFKAELSQTIFKDELSDLWLVGIDTNLVPDVCLYVEDVEFKEANFSFSRLNNIHFNQVHFFDVICQNTTFSGGKIFFKCPNPENKDWLSRKNAIRCLGDVDFENMALDGGGVLSFNEPNDIKASEVSFSESFIINMVITMQFNRINFAHCVFKRARLHVSANIRDNKKNVILYSYFIDIDQKQGFLIDIQKPFSEESEFFNFVCLLNFDETNTERFLRWRSTIPRNAINFYSFGTNTYQFKDKASQDRILSITDWKEFINAMEFLDANPLN